MTADAIIKRLADLTGVMLEKDSASEPRRDQFHGYVCVNGVEYKFWALRSEDRPGYRRRWHLRLRRWPPASSGSPPPERAA